MAYWTQLCAEHGIAPDGVAREKCDPDEFTESLFAHSHMGTYSPRSIMIDTDPGSLGHCLELHFIIICNLVSLFLCIFVDWIRLGECRDLYNPGKIEIEMSLFSRVKPSSILLIDMVRAAYFWKGRCCRMFCKRLSSFWETFYNTWKRKDKTRVGEL